MKLLLFKREMGIYAGLDIALYLHLVFPLPLRLYPLPYPCLLLLCFSLCGSGASTCVFNSPWVKTACLLLHLSFFFNSLSHFTESSDAVNVA